MSYLPKQSFRHFFFCLLFVPVGCLAEAEIRVVRGQYLIKLNGASTRSTTNPAHEEPFRLVSLLSTLGARSANEDVSVLDETKVENDCESIRADIGELSYCEPNVLWTTSAVPNDPKYDALYAASKLKLPEAWALQSGSPSVLIAVLDTGVDYTHEDLSDNIWVNQLEIPNNGLDDDGNGYVDDLYGIDTFNADTDPLDDHGHGTHVAGTIGAVGSNNVGVTGVNWNTRIMALKFLGSNGSGSTLNAVTAIDYAIDHGVDVINASFGGGFYSQALYEAVERAEKAGVLFVAAAGNSNQNNDLKPQYPSGFTLSNVVAVAASDQDDDRAWFSNYGENTVHVTAPGANILSTLPQNKYGLLSGTSMAAPQVSGIAGLVFSEYPHYSPEQVKYLMMNSSHVMESLVGVSQSSGRVDAEAAILLGKDAENTLPGKGGTKPPEQVQPGNKVKILLRRSKGRGAQRRFRGKMKGGSSGSTENVSLLLRNSAGMVECELGMVSLGAVTHIRGKYPAGISRARLRLGEVLSKERRVRSRKKQNVNPTNKLMALENACSRVGVTLHQANNK